MHALMITLRQPPQRWTTVYGVVDRLLEKLPDLRRHWLDDQGEIRAHVHIFINGDEISTLADGWSTPLQPEDVLDFIPPVAGG